MRLKTKLRSKSTCVIYIDMGKEDIFSNNLRQRERRANETNLQYIVSLRRKGDVLKYRSTMPSPSSIYI